MEPLKTLRSWMLANQRGSDILVAVFAFVITVVGLLFLPPEPDDPSIGLLGLSLAILPAFAVLFRRTHPIQALIFAATLGFTYWILDYPNAGASFTVAILLYSVGRYTGNRIHSTRALVGFTVVLMMVLVTGFFYEGEEEVTLGVIVMNVIIYQLVWVAGDTVRNRIDAIAELAKRIDSAENEQMVLTAQAVAEERNRIARELHDIMAHSLSVIVVQAEGAKRNVGRDDQTVTDALQTIEQTARSNLKDLRGVVGMLREDETGRSPAPELSMVSTLVTQCSEAGLPVSLSITGNQRVLPPMIELSGYRIVQESLTNAMKHAGPGAKAQITLGYEMDQLLIAVVDNGRGAGRDQTQTAGHGLIGMRERVEAFGGRLAAGPKIGGGFSVVAHLPVAAQ